MRATARCERAWHIQQTYNSALCCALFGPLYIDTSHEYYSWALFFFFFLKSTKMNPMNLGLHKIE